VSDTKTDLDKMFGDMLKRIAGGEGTVLDAAQDDILEHELASIIVPRGMSMEHLSEVALKKAAELNKIHNFTHITQFRPEDGANAAAEVIREMFGLTVGKATRTMFGENPPEFRTIDVAYGVKKEVPWGQLEIPALPGASFHFLGTEGKVGPVFAVQATSPKKHKARIEAFFTALDEKLKVASIYRGHPLMGARELSFMNVKNFRANEIVFADHVQRTLDAALFGLLERTEETKAAGLSTKRTLLAFGPYGTGKSSLGLITAQRAEKAGWTYLAAKAGRDNLKDVLTTAKMYQPAVVFIEDIETHTPKASDKDAVSELLDLFDGIGTKDDKILVVMTSNHIEQVPAGMLRPGRLDYTVEINGLDRGGVERLIKRVVPADVLAGDVDFDAVFAPMAEWQPAWVRAAADRAQAYALAESTRTPDGKLNYTITTQNLVDAAESLVPQLNMMRKASEGYSVPELHEALAAEVAKAVKSALKETAITYAHEPTERAYRFNDLVATS
jgi:SpoVK/Ycf46/Vps4 family AAA+-type ATPase